MDLPSSWFVRFSAAFAEHLEARHGEVVAQWEPSPRWTSTISGAVYSAAIETFGSNVKFASRGNFDGFKHEYLSIDGTIHDNSWSRPILTVELENDHRQLRYAAWKLLCTRPEHRLLIGYHPGDVDALLGRIREVTHAHPDCELHLLLAPLAHPARAPEQWLGHYARFRARGSSIEAI